MKPAFLGVAAALLLAACTNANDLDKVPAYLGNFSLGHNVAVAPNLTKGPASRDASADEWITAMKSAVDERFSRYEGDKLYHIAVSIEGYVLAVTGIPLVAAPKSALIIRVTAWDDAAGKKLNPEPEQITVIETISGNTMLGSGLTQTKEVQMENLSRNAAKLIQNWLVRENARNGWFEEGDAPSASEPVAAPEANTAATETADTGKPDTGTSDTGTSGTDTPETEVPEVAAPQANAPKTDPTESEDIPMTPAQQAAAASDVVIEPEVTPGPAVEPAPADAEALPADDG